MSKYNILSSYNLDDFYETVKQMNESTKIYTSHLDNTVLIAKLYGVFGILITKKNDLENQIQIKTDDLEKQIQIKTDDLRKEFLIKYNVIKIFSGIIITILTISSLINSFKKLEN